MTTRYQKRHYEDVAQILARSVGITADCDQTDCGCKVETPAIANDFANLFDADNPKRCTFHGDHDTGYSEDCKITGFSREQFLTACGLESEG